MRHVPVNVMEPVRTRLNENGRLVIPAAIRKALDLLPGDEVVLAVEDDALRIVNPKRAVREAQDLIRRYIPEGEKLSEQLIAQRRVEADRE